ncbi:MAG: hypothetical protein PHO12_08535, partial [Bacteroidales bacterium]|nr:hypothetical protein [Bacteroidales bacterium]
MKIDFKNKKSVLKLVYNVLLYGFALCGVLIIGAWAFYQLGFTKNGGGVDKNNRYLADVAQMQKEVVKSQVEMDREMSENY